MEKELEWKHVKEFQLGWTGAVKSSILFLKFDDDTTANLSPNSIQELYVIGELLRSGKNIEYAPKTQDFRLAWESTK